jgi:hypothetical protein
VRCHRGWAASPTYTSWSDGIVVQGVTPVTVNEAVVGWTVTARNTDPQYTGYMAAGTVCFRLDQ